MFLVAAAVGCSNHAEVKRAQHSLYDTDFAVVYSAVMDATRKLYPNIDDSPGIGSVKTAWHQVQFANNDDELGNTRVVNQDQQLYSGGMGQNAGQSGAAQSSGMPTRIALKKYFVRFEIMVMGGRPWRVKVVGHAASWETGAAMPTELHGLAKPPWLEGRTQALQLAIYKKIRQYAVPMKDPDPADELKHEDEVPKTDPATFVGVPAPAAKRLAALKDSLASRDYKGLRAQLSDDVIWSLGGGSGADTAMSMWQADPEALDAMAKVLVGGCGAAGDKRIACPAGDPVAGQFQLVIEDHDGWKVVSFVKAE
ncbi:MAG TPA: hypothetical protein VGM88_00165 [Kofleriaceae bacterium]